jgi:hypothetical protein
LCSWLAQGSQIKPKGHLCGIVMILGK